MALEFQQGTLSSIKDFLSTETIIHLLTYNDALDQCFSPPKEHQLCLGHISVAANYRRLGIATALIEHAKVEAAKVCKTELILDAETSNRHAVDCYLKAGFTVTKQSIFEATQQTFSRMTLLC
jgi:ribosomal protein S18 acetylase RimI-like enzyme